MGELAEAGCVAFSQAEAPLADTQVLLRAMQYAATFGHRVWLRPQEPLSCAAAASRTTARSRRASGLPAIPPAAETIALATIFALVRVTGVRVHLGRLSTADGVAMVRAAKADGLAGDLRRRRPPPAPVRRRHRLVRCAMPARPAAARASRDRAALRARARRRHHRRRLLRSHARRRRREAQLPFAEAAARGEPDWNCSYRSRWNGPRQRDNVRLSDALAKITHNPARVRHRRRLDLRCRPGLPAICGVWIHRPIGRSAGARCGARAKTRHFWGSRSGLRARDAGRRPVVYEGRGTPILVRMQTSSVRSHARCRRQIEQLLPVVAVAIADDHPGRGSTSGHDAERGARAGTRAPLSG